MLSLVLAFLCSSTLCLATSDSQPDNIVTLMDNVVVVRVPQILGPIVSVPLSCGEAFKNKPVFWKKDGEDIQPVLSGNQVTVRVEEMHGGNYTCHLGPDGEYLNHTTILIQLEPDNRTVILEEKSPEEGHIRCTAPNYDGSFHCTWTRTQSRSKAQVVMVKAKRHHEAIPCELDADGSGVRCQDANCSHVEEKHRISITVYIRSFSRLEAYTRTFFLMEIVKPERLPNLRMSEWKVFSWDHPHNWSKPCTYYSLEFEVKVVPHRQTCASKELSRDVLDETKYAVTLKTNRFVFCVRAKDKFTEGLWSHWSHCTINKEEVHC